MSLIRQTWLWLLLTLLPMLLGGVAVSLVTARAALQAQLQQQDRNQAVLLAAALSAQQGDRAAMARLLARQFESGAYAKLRYEAAAGGAPLLHERAAEPRAAPPWFVRWLASEHVPGRAQLVDGARVVGAVEVVGRVDEAQDALWQATVLATVAMLAAGLVAGIGATVAVRRVRRPLAAAVHQARELVEGRYITLAEPAQPELRALTRAMNSMVGRLKARFELQAAEVEQLRLQTQCDSVTGLALRSHFLARLEAALQGEDGAQECGLVLLRLHDLAGVNRSVGHLDTDRILGAIADALRPYPARVAGCFLGRLNGADFALCLPVGGMAFESAHALSAALKVVLPALGPGIAVALGAVELARETPLGVALSAADDALARAEAGKAFAVELGDAGAGARAPVGEGAWRHGIASAMAGGRARLAEFPLVDAGLALVHLECPLRLQLDADGPFELAARWLPRAVRARLTAEVDTRAVALALAAIGRDGQPRSVNVAQASVVEAGFAQRLHALCVAAPGSARKLSLEVPEAPALDALAQLQDFARRLRPCGVKVGLEHAGAGGMLRSERLFAAGLDFVKLDIVVTRGLAADAQRAAFVRGSVELLHGLGLAVYAEGVADEADAHALWACGADGITGPWASVQRDAGA